VLGAALALYRLLRSEDFALESIPPGARNPDDAAVLDFISISSPVACTWLLAPAFLSPIVRRGSGLGQMVLSGTVLL
jgi:hypothetical protein